MAEETRSETSEGYSRELEEKISVAREDVAQLERYLSAIRKEVPIGYRESRNKRNSLTLLEGDLAGKQRILRDLLKRKGIYEY